MCVAIHPSICLYITHIQAEDHSHRDSNIRACTSTSSSTYPYTRISYLAGGMETLNEQAKHSAGRSLSSTPSPSSASQPASDTVYFSAGWQIFESVVVGIRSSLVHSYVVRLWSIQSIHITWYRTATTIPGEVWRARPYLAHIADISYIVYIYDTQRNFRVDGARVAIDFSQLKARI